MVDELPRLRDELARLQANVNLNAEAERDEVAERERFLRTQMDDLAKARETLLESIREIERETQVQFNETFTRVAEAFSQMYARLFPGGEAQDVADAARESLRDGNRDLGAAAGQEGDAARGALGRRARDDAPRRLIFALIATKPAPFYLLDEVDAALDDANIERFSDDGARVCRRVADAHRDAQQEDDGNGRPHLRRDHARSRRQRDRLGGARSAKRRHCLPEPARRQRAALFSLFDKTGAAELARR